jgi:uncharacterized membrane protein
MRWHIFWALLLGALAGCGGGEGTLEEVDPEAAPMEPTYTEHVAPIMDRYCVSCHSAEALPGRVDGYGYGTCAEVRDNWGGVVWTVFEGKTMPPGGAPRVTSSDQLTLRRWHEQGAVCP